MTQNAFPGMTSTEIQSLLIREAHWPKGQRDLNHEAKLKAELDRRSKERN